MDDFVKTTLESWGLLDRLRVSFDVNEVDKQTLLNLDREDLKELIPILSTRKLFGQKLEKLKIEHQCTQTFIHRLKECPKIESHYICNGDPLPISNNCEANLLGGNHMKNCLTIPIETTIPLIEQISPNHILVHSEKDVTLKYSCISSGIQKISGAALISIPEQCTVEIEGISYRNDPGLLPGLPFDLPPVQDLSESVKANREPSLVLKKVRLDNLHHIQEIMQFQPKTKTEDVPIHQEVLHYFNIPLIILVTGIICFFGYKKVHTTKSTKNQPRTKKPRNQENQDVELQDLQAPTSPF